MNYDAHPAANIFPMMPEADLEEMAADIKENGLLNPIEIFEGKIIDGRNRYRACQKIGLRPRFYEIQTGDDFDAVSYVLSLNLHRRHLTTSQRAMVAVEVEKVYAEEAKENLKLSKGRGIKGKANLPDLNCQARDKAAEMLNVGGRSVSDAKKVFGDGIPELAEKVTQGEVSVSAAAKAANLNEEIQKEIVEEINQGGKPAEVIKAHVLVTKHTGDEESYTPPIYLDAALRVMGSIDTDPASNPMAQENVKAKKYYTLENDGLKEENTWDGNVWMNPPYTARVINKFIENVKANKYYTLENDGLKEENTWDGNVWMNPPYTARVINKFIEKVIDQKENGICKQAIVLTNNNTDTTWFHAMLDAGASVCFTRGRINFLKRDGSKSSPTNGQAFFYLGDNHKEFNDVFSAFGKVMR